MDRADAKLLEALQSDSTQSIAKLAEEAALSPSACHRRIRALEQSGVIAGYGARLNPERLGLSLVAFVEISLNSQSHEAMDRFEAAVRDFDDILDCHLMSGVGDYLLRVAVPDIAAYDVFYKKLISRIEIAKVSSAFAMEQMKYTTAMPLQFAATAQSAKSERD